MLIICGLCISRNGAINENIACSNIIYNICFNTLLFPNKYVGRSYSGQRLALATNSHTVYIDLACFIIVPHFGGCKMTIIVYIASPYRIGDRLENTFISMSMGHRLMDLGYHPIVPLLSHFMDEQHERPETEYLEYDFTVIKIHAEAAKYGDDDYVFVLLRLPGESRGAELEILLTQSLNVPVVYSIAELLEKYPSEKVLMNRSFCMEANYGKTSETGDL